MQTQKSHFESFRKGRRRFASSAGLPGRVKTVKRGGHLSQVEGRVYSGVLADTRHAKKSTKFRGNWLQEEATNKVCRLSTLSHETRRSTGFVATPAPPSSFLFFGVSFEGGSLVSASFGISMCGPAAFLGSGHVKAYGSKGRAGKESGSLG